MKKLLLLLGCVFIVTGCTVDYKITINDDLSINEKVNMYGSDEFFAIYNKSSRLNIVNMLLDNERDILNENNYRYEIIDGASPYVEVNKNYDDINEFINNTVFFEQYFEDVDYQNKDGIITIKTRGFMPNDEEDPNRFDIKRANISITCLHEVVDHNATSVDKSTNTYTWNIGSNDQKMDIMLSYDTNYEFINKQEFEDMELIIMIIIIMVASWIVAIVFNKKRRTAF